MELQQMGLKKLAAKVAQYNERLESGKASKIKPSHVRRVLEKLRAKESSLEAEIAAAGDEERARLERKLEIAREQISRAEWLLAEVD
jgi:hypothetical protein